MLESKMTRMTGLNMTDEVRFVGQVRYGRGNAVIGVNVGKAEILALAEALKHAGSVGHAVWHVENPDCAMPCETCAVQSSTILRATA